jgi:hypothetical protein
MDDDMLNKIFEIKEKAGSVAGLTFLFSAILYYNLFSPFYPDVRPLFYSPEREIIIAALILLPTVTTILCLVWYFYKKKKILSEK